MDTKPAPPFSDDDSVLDFCCNKKKCPKLTDDGEHIVIEDPDQSPSPILLTREQGLAVHAWLAKRLGA